MELEMLCDEVCGHEAHLEKNEGTSQHQLALLFQEQFLTYQAPLKLVRLTLNYR